MSIKLMTAIWHDNTLKSVEKLVLLAIADCANDEGYCWPSLENLSLKTSLSIDGVSRIINRLVKHGYLVKKRRFGRSTIYIFDFQSFSTQSRVHFRPAVETDIDPESKEYNETSIKEPSMKHKYIGHFNEFWDLYPKKVAKEQASKAYTKALKGTAHETIIAGLNRHVANWSKGFDKQFIPNAATWLNGKRWEDEIINTNPTTTPNSVNRSTGYHDELLANAKRLGDMYRT